MNLKQLRISAGVSQKDFAEGIGMKTQQQLNNIERGACDLPIKYVKKAAKLLKVDAKQLQDLIVTMKIKKMLQKS